MENKKLDLEFLLRMNLYFTLGTCAIFVLFEFFVGAFLLGLFVFVLGCVVTSLQIVFKKKLDFEKRAIIMSVSQVVVIFLVSVIEGTVHESFSLFLAFSVLTAFYFKRKIVAYQQIAMNICLVFSMIFFKDLAYGITGYDTLIKELVSVNLGVTFLYFVIRWANHFMDESKENLKVAQEKANETTVLMKEIEERMERGNRLVDVQKQMIGDIQQTAHKVNDFSNDMLQISKQLDSGSEAQNHAIDVLKSYIQEVTKQIETTSHAAIVAKNLSHQAGDKLNYGNLELQKMLDAISQIQTTSEKINAIIKTINEISFQTNILALNAAVEAARAGESGKGFAVVASEVGKLSNQTTEAANLTSDLIKDTVQAIQQGIQIANETAETLRDAMDSSQQSIDKMDEISNMSNQQVEFISQMSQSMRDITDVVSQNAQVATESTNVSTRLAKEVREMENIIEKAAVS